MSAPNSFVRIGASVAYLFAQGRRRALLAITFLALASVAEGGTIMLLVPVLHLVTPGSADLVIPAPASLAPYLGPAIHMTLATMLLAVVALVSLQALLIRAKNIYMTQLLSDAIMRLRLDLFAAVSRAQWRFVGGQRSADFHHALTADVERVQAGIMHTLLLLQNIGLLCAYLAASLLLSPIMTAFMMLAGAVALVALGPIRRRAARQGERLTETQQQQYRTIGSFLDGLKTAKALNAEPRFYAQLKGVLDTGRADYLSFTNASAGNTAVLQIANVSALALFAWLALSVIALPMASLLTLVVVFVRLSPRFSALQGDIQQILLSTPALESMRAIQDQCMAAQESERHQGGPPAALSQALDLRGVSFAHDGARGVSDLRFTIRANKITALVGPSGAGKSTIADLLVGLLEPDAGEICADGAPLEQIGLAAWRDHVGYVSQDGFLLNDTVRANLLLAAPQASENEMWDCLERASAKTLVETLPRGLDTFIGDRGGALSAGERQRIVLARALLRRPLLLVLDEATNALDWRDQAMIARSIAALRGSTTIVSIEHRPALITFADWVVEIENGRVIQEGPFETLSQRPGSRLARMVATETPRAVG